MLLLLFSSTLLSLRFLGPRGKRILEYISRSIGAVLNIAG
ncbi:hypothetical protein SBA6_40058 [Candidatus Sulfopaludibacter sp. SbA6]|nr:hypothetical protein SBA6_40058 [Candidatus Sulfopaludibacter sp. SbA6]